MAKDIRATLTLDLVQFKAAFQQAVEIAKADGKAIANALSNNTFSAAGFTQQGAQAAAGFTAAFDQAVGRWRDQNGKFTTPPIHVEAPQVNIPPANFQVPTGSLTSGLAKDRAELDQFIARLKAGEADMKAMGQIGSEEFHIIQNSIKLAEGELAKFDAEAQKAAANAKKSTPPAGGKGIFKGGFDVSQLSNVGSSIGALGGGGLGNILTSLPPQFQIAGLAATAFVKVFDGLEDIGKKFEKAEKIIVVGTGAVGAELESLKGSLKTVFNSSTQPLEVIAKDLSVFKDRLGVTGEPLERLTLQFEKLKELGTSADSGKFARFLGDAGIPAKDASAALDQLFVASQKTAVPFDRLQELMVKFGAPLRNFGFGVAESAALLGSFEKNGVNTELVMGSLRIAAGKFASANVDLKTGLNDAIVSIKNAKTQTEGLQIANATFGKRAGADMADTIRGGKFAVDELVASLSNTEGAINKAKGATATIGSAFTKLGHQAESALEPLGSIAVDALNAVGKGAQDLLGPLISGVAEFVGFISEPIAKFFDFIGGAKGAFAELGGFLIGGPVGLGIVFLLTKLEQGTGAVSKFIATIKATFANAGPIISAFIDVVKESLNPANLLPGSDGFDQAKKKLADSISKLGQDVSDGIKGVDLGRALTDAASIKEDLDKNGELQKLIDKFKGAKTEAEKNSIGAEIAKQAPGAIAGIEQITDAQGRITSQYKINVGAAQEFATAQKDGFSAELTSKQEDFTEGLKSQVDQYGKNRTALAALSKEIVANAGNKEKVRELSDQYRKLEVDTNNSAKAVGETVKKGQGLGLVSSDVNELGKQFGQTAVEANNVAEQTGKIKGQVDDAAASVDNLAKAYKEAAAAAKSGVDTGFGAIRELQNEVQALLKEQNSSTIAPERKIAIGLEIKDKQKQILDLKAQTKDAIRDVNQEDAEDKRLRIELGLDKIKPGEVKDVFADIQAKIKDLQSQNKVSLISDDGERERLALEERRKKALADLGIQRKKLSDEAKKDPAKFTNVGPALAALDKGGALFVEIERQFAIELQKINDKAEAARLEKIKKGLQEEATARSEGAKLQATALNLVADNIKGSGEAAETERLSKRLQAIDLERAAEIEAKVSANDDVLKAQAKFEEAQKSGDATRIANARAALIAARQDVLTNNGEVLAILQKFGIQRAEIEKKGNTAIDEGVVNDRIAQLSSIDAQERAFTLAALDKRLKDEQEANKNNQAQLARIVREGVEERAKIEATFLAKTKPGYAAYGSFVEGFQKTLTRTVTAEDQKRLTDELSKNSDAVAALRESYATRRIDIKTFNADYAKLSEERVKIEADAAGQTPKFWEKIRSAVSDGFQAGADSQKATIDSLTDGFRQAGNLTVDAGGNFTDRLSVMGAELADLGAGMLVTLGATGAKALVEGENVGKAVAKIAFDTLQSLVPIFSAQLLGLKLTSPVNAIPGGTAIELAEWAGLTALLEGVVAAARGALKLKDGRVGVRGPGGTTGDKIPTYISDWESVITAKGTLAGGAGPEGNRAALNWANLTGGSLMDYFDGLPASRNKLTFAQIERMHRPEFNRITVEHFSTIERRLTERHTAAQESQAGQIQRLTEEVTKSNRELASMRGHLSHLTDIVRPIRQTAEHTEQTAKNTITKNFLR